MEREGRRGGEVGLGEYHLDHCEERDEDEPPATYLLRNGLSVHSAPNPATLVILLNLLVMLSSRILPTE